MQILIGIIIVAAIIYIIGIIDNKRPVSDWSDEKLVRMRSKLQRAASACFDASDMAGYKKHSDKKQEVDNEIVKRERKFQEQQVSEFKNPAMLGDDCIISEKALQEADAGDVEAQFLVGCGYLSGANGLPQDPIKATKYLLMAAHQNHAGSAFIISGLYVQGIGLPTDKDKARAWAFKAKQLGYPDADEMIQAIDAA